MIDVLNYLSDILESILYLSVGVLVGIIILIYICIKLLNNYNSL